MAKSLKTETVIDEDLPQAAGEGYRLASTFYLSATDSTIAHP